ncbi:MAG TPA: hypothetical protein VGR93_04870, partial [Candidatus Acidoferrales bacterium]|nr:hypothetical protein [Candidatus Acidoferrales bacterium]
MVASLIVAGPSAARAGAGGGPNTVAITVTMNQAGVFGGDSNVGTIQLSQLAPAGGLTVHMG